MNSPAAKRAGAAEDVTADVTAWEQKIDLPREIGREAPAHLGSRRLVSRGERVFRLYGLTPAESKMVDEMSQ